jgi:CTP synthase
MVVCRSEAELSTEIRAKIALFASLPVEAIVSAYDVEDVYRIPLVFNDQGVDDFILGEHFGLEAGAPDLSCWEAITRRAASAHRRVRIALVGKYVQLEDAYLSVAEALRHAGVHHDAEVEIDWVDSETVSDPEVTHRLHTADGILIPGGFGGRGWEGKIGAARIARTQRIPYLGICLGMHVAVSEFARHVAGMEGANSTEMDLETPFPVIDLLPEQKEIADMGGTMRLGADPVKLHDGTRIRELYGDAVVYERHRHRYEVNNHLRKRLENAGLICSGTSPDERLVEAVELARDAHPFYVASQYHPEFKSRPERPAPVFREFVGSALEHAEARLDREPSRSGAEHGISVSRGAGS